MSIASQAAATQPLSAMRPPAVPLVTCDPYFSVWSMSDQLTDEWTKHWTGAIQAMCGLARIDGQCYRFMGVMPDKTPAMEQKQVTVLPTRTVYVFEAGGLRLCLTFLTPSLPCDLAVMSRPVAYISWDAQSADGKSHDVSIYFDCSAEWAVDKPNQKVVWGRYQVEGLRVMRFGSHEQPMLEKRGDDLRIDWGHFYLAIPESTSCSTIMAGHGVRHQFAHSGTLPANDDLRMPRPANDDPPVLACAFDPGSVGVNPPRQAAGHVILAYDDVLSIEYLGRRLRPYWRQSLRNAAELLMACEMEHAEIAARCAALDDELMADLIKAGGEHFAAVAVLAFRQCIAAHKLAADFDGTPLMFSKENFSNGCIATVDVTYPSSPFFLLFNPELLQAQLTPVLEYASSPRWKFPFAPHDLGTYPLANGQVYGGGERTEDNQMPVEESGNMLIMTGALAHIQGSAAYAEKYWPTLTKWANYLREKGLDPENQLCTDDFAGHLAHNTNLSLKAVMAIGCYARLCEMTGRTQEAEQWRNTAQQMASEWVRKADDGDHFRLAFDKPGTWSQKYNLVWDKLLGLNLFPPDIARKEAAFYKTKLAAYGLPLDNRSEYTKLDWSVWTAALCEKPDDFALFLAPIYRWVNETPQRVPMTDWYWTNDGRRAGFQARSVVGGVFIPMLANPQMWKKWATCPAK
ncbi:MAG: DUF4965 domain-containing protein [bacterium]